MITLPYAAERHLRHGARGPLDYGDERRLVREPCARRRLRRPLMTATLKRCSLLGRTPPLWRWRPDVLATVGTHVAYAAGVAAVDDGIRRGAGAS
jgi:hypothetical protein